MRLQGNRSRLTVAALGLAALAAPAVLAAGSATAATETETYLSFTSDPGDYIGQGQTHSYTQADSTFTVSGTAGQLRLSVDGGSDWWSLTLAAPAGQQLTTGRYSSTTRAPFNTTTAGLDFSGSGRGCNTSTGSMTIYALSADTHGTITSLDADVEQHCEGAAAALRATVKYQAPYVVPLVLTSSNPTSVEGQPVTLTARIAPGTNPTVAFTDGTTVLGQATADATGTARFTTSALTAGDHALRVHQGTAFSAALTQSVRPGSVSYWFQSQNRDYIGQGATASYAPSTATITAAGTAAYLTVSVTEGSDDWSIDLAAPLGARLTRGTYTGATRAPFRSGSEPGLEVSGNGRGCNTLGGSFTIDAIAFDGTGKLQVLDATFTQRCENGPAELTGRVRLGAVAQTTTTVTAATEPGGRTTVDATVAATAGQPTGTVTFTDSSGAVVTAPLTSNGTARVVLTLARGTHTLTARYSGADGFTASQASTSITVTGFATTTTMTTPKSSVKAGKATSFTVAVTGAGPSTPSGTVRLFDGVEPVGSASLVSGAATITWAPVAKGMHSLTARYDGSASTEPSTSSPITLRVT